MPSEMNLVDLTAEIACAYVTHNSLSTADLTKLIGDVHRALAGLGGATEIVPEVEAQRPAVSVRKSITPDFLICLEDGKKFKSLKRHLQRAYGLTLEDYREKWHLPFDYPMVAPNYSASRSALAKSIGLGRKPKQPIVKSKGRRAAI
jgi:predicted transcriptional regulator